MDTKWRRFSRSRAVRVLLVLLYIACFFAVGAITGYAPAYGYNSDDYAYCVESLFADSYGESAAYRQQVINSFYKIASPVRENSAYEQFFSSAMLEELNELPFYCEIKFGDYTRTNNKAADNIYYISKKSNWEQIQTEQGTEVDFVHQKFEISFLMYESDYIRFGFTDEQVDEYEQSWMIMRHNTQVILCSTLALIVAAILLTVFLCRVSGEDAEGNAVWSRFFALPYELSLGAAVGVAALYLFVMLDDTKLTNMCYSHNGRAFFMFLCGLITTVFGLIMLYFFVSIAVRRKNKRALRGSLIGLALILCMKLMKLVLRSLKFIGKQILRFFRFVKEVFTGELYSGTVARKLIFLDSVFIIVSCLLFLVILCSECAPLILLEMIFLGLFVYGRVLLVKDQAKLEKQINMIYSGSYDHKPELCKNSPYQTASDQLSEISAQYRKGIEETIKAERTKMELVTNVSHDLKTPLTSIIGYIELLSKEQLPEEAAEHVRILQMKSERLKNIVSDVFELAKTTSGEISIEKEPLDLTKLSYQTLGEMEDKIAASGLDIKVNICEPPVTVISDGKRLYRVIQNLLDNALKYSLHGTRIYYTLEKRGGRAYITVKNIASYEMTFTKEEILERFTRGDKSRSTEGTGLGLSIAQGFTLACGGSFDVDIDGDMFKVVLSFPIETVSLDKTVASDE